MKRTRVYILVCLAILLLASVLLTSCFFSKKSSSSSETKEYQVDFYCDGMLVSGMRVKAGEVCEPLERVDKDYYTFVDWYADEELTTLFDFTKPITKDVIVHAKMQENAIRTPEQLIALNNNNGYWRIKTDIDLSSIEEWTPIEGFTGKLDGQDHKITGLKIREENTYVGLFGQLKGNVYNLELTVDIQLSGEDPTPTVDTFCGVGGLCGYATGATDRVIAKNITVKGTINAPGKVHVGGVIGRTGHRVVACTNEATITGKINVGGIVGFHQSNNGQKVESGIFDCVNKASVTGTTSVGGIVGSCYNKKPSSDSGLNQYIWRNENKGAVTGSDNIGGIIGMFNSAFNSSYVYLELRDCKNSGNVTATDHAAAFVGRLYSTSIESAWSTDTNTGLISGANAAQLYNNANGQPVNSI